MFFRHFFSPAPEAQTARDIYSSIVAKARQPYFYAVLGVPDTIDGRFDMILLHAILLMNRLAQGSPAARDLAQKIFDELFADMDRSLREMGVGDLSVGKRVRKMAMAFYGRAKAYRDALAENDTRALQAALARNIFPEGVDAGTAANLTAYVLACARTLSLRSETELLEGRVSFPNPENRLP
jgi:cytochrome b pre-mRNA-processing protein 3